MNQPKLGLTVAMLRKTRGLTQEELAEYCGINVRSLQRIENGQVVPRLFTLKQLSKYLDFNLLTPAETDTGTEQKTRWWELDNFGARRTGWIAGILYFLLSIPETAMLFWRYTDNLDFYGRIFYNIISVAVMVTAVFFYRGFVAIGSKLDQSLLTVCSWLFIVLTLVIYTFDVYTIWTGSEREVVVVVALLTSGFTAIFFGIGLSRTESELGNAAKMGGILEIVTGICFVLIVTSLIGLITLLPAIILEIIVLYKAAQVFGGSPSQSGLVTEFSRIP